MKLNSIIVAPVLVAMGTSAIGHGAETGDFDGDGRLSIGDVIHSRTGLEPAPGSREGFDSHPCHGAATGWDASVERAIVYFESLRRAVPGSLPHWLPVWDPAAGPGQAPLLADSRVSVLVEDVIAPGGADDRVRIQLVIVAHEPVRAFSLLIEAEEGVLRAPLSYKEGSPAFKEGHWNAVEGSLLYSQVTNNVKVMLQPAAYLITGGKLVLTNFWGTRDGQDLGPGAIPLELELRLPRGTKAGRYSVRLLPGSEALLVDGTLLGIASDGPGSVAVVQDIEAGWDEGVPPLVFDVERRRVLGKVQFRLADGEGQPAEPGLPVAEGLPGDEVAVRLQMRTDVPLNRISARLFWPGGDLRCSEGSRILFPNPEDGGVYGAVDLRGNGPFICGEGFFGFDGGFEVHFGMTGSFFGGFPTGLYKDRPLEHFKSLGDWVDLAEMRLVISDQAAGGTEAPLRFLEGEKDDEEFNALVSFAPYGVRYPCDSSSRGDDRPASWTYEVAYSSSAVFILDDSEPPPEPVDAGVRIVLGSTAARPGELVEIPILVAAERPLRALRIVLEGDQRPRRSTRSTSRS